MRRKFLSILLALVMVLGMLPATALAAGAESEQGNETYVAQVGETKYTDLQTAVGEAEGKTVTLLGDITGAETIIVNKSIKLDLNGNDIENTGSGWVLKVDGNSTMTLTDNSTEANGTVSGVKGISVVQGSKLIMDGGNIAVTGETGAAIQVYGSEAVMNGGNITAEYGAILIYSNNDVRGTFTMNDGKIDSKSPAIYANGSEAWDNVDVTITGGELVSEVSVIYWPAAGKLTITGGELTGNTTVYVKSGSLEITGGTLTATGEKKDYEYVSSAHRLTGDALAIENVASNDYEAIGSVSITGGTFTSANAEAVASYAATSVNPEAVAVTGFITGGTFSSDPSDFVVEDYIITEADGKYTVAALSLENAAAAIGATPYATLAAAIEAATEGQTVTLLGNITGTDTIIVNKSITLDLNGNTIENTGSGWVLKVDGNSTMTLTDNSAEANGTVSGVKGISVVQGSKLIMDGGNIAVTGETGAAIQVYGSEATMNGGNITA